MSALSVVGKQESAVDCKARQAEFANNFRNLAGTTEALPDVLHCLCESGNRDIRILQFSFCLLSGIILQVNKLK